MRLEDRQAVRLEDRQAARLEDRQAAWLEVRAVWLEVRAARLEDRRAAWLEVRHLRWALDARMPSRKFVRHAVSWSTCEREPLVDLSSFHSN